MDLKEYYELESKELDTGDKTSSPLASAGHKEAAKKKDPLQRKELLGQQLRLVEKQSKELVQLIDTAKSGVIEALALLVDAFREPARIVKVRLIEPLRDKEGKELKQFGMKELSDDPEKAEKQRIRLREDFSIAKQFFKDIELREIDSADSKRVVVIVGVDAEEFNAVVKAEKTRIQLEIKVAQITQDIEKAQKEIEEARRKQDLLDRSAASKVASSPKSSESSLVLH